MQEQAGPPIHGLDIETDTSVDGLDPRCAAITAVAVASASGTVVFDGPEPELLRALNTHLESLPAGIIATWNGAGFDLPFLAERAARVGLRPEEWSLRARADHALPQRRSPLPGHPHLYRATWGRHHHVDVYRVYRADVGCWFGWSCGLKAVARLAGLPAVTEDAGALHELAPERVRAYVASDARLTRELLIRRGPTALGAVDPPT